MSRDEAIMILKNFSLCGVYHQLIHMNDTDSEAISMAIKALEQPEPCDDVEFWRKRAEYYSKMCFDLIADMNKGVKIDSVEINEDGIKFTKKQPEPCEDAVSREAAIKCCTFGRTSLGLIDELRRLPSVTPKQRWIPVSERLPEDSNFYIVTHKDFLVGFIWYSVLHGLEWEEQPIAWMPLPEPWKGAEE